MLTADSPRPILSFDLGSPYAYLALHRAAAVLGVEPVLEPVLLGAIFARRGWGSWSAEPERGERVADIEQRARRYGLPEVRWPDGWPRDGLIAMRAATWALREGCGDAFARSVYAAQFARGEEIDDPVTLDRCATEAGLDAGALPGAVRDPAIKLALRDATEHAWAAGVRGVPSVRIGDAVFYGDDQLEAAAAHLQG